jgi:hypothetical protein
LIDHFNENNFSGLAEMTAFYRRSAMSYDSVARTLERLLDIRKQRRAARRDLMMLGHDVAPNEPDIFVGLPHRRLAHGFPEFVEVERKGLPVRPGGFHHSGTELRRSLA